MRARLVSHALMPSIFFSSPSRVSRSGARSFRPAWSVLTSGLVQVVTCFHWFQSWPGQAWSDAQAAQQTSRSRAREADTHCLRLFRISDFFAPFGCEAAAFGHSTESVPAGTLISCLPHVIRDPRQTAADSAVPSESRRTKTSSASVRMSQIGLMQHAGRGLVLRIAGDDDVATAVGQVDQQGDVLV